MAKKVWGMYFSGTGTTKKMVTYIAKELANKIGAEYTPFDFTLPAARAEAKVYEEDDIVVLGTPVIAGRVPNLLLKYLDTVAGNGAYGIPVVLYGNRNFDDALIELRNIMEKDGFHTIAGGAFVGEHSFSTTLGKGRPDDEDMTVAAELVCRIVEKIESGNINEDPIAVKGENPIRPYYTPRDRNGNGIDIRKVKPKTDESKCVKCGFCAKNCPLGSINPEDVTQITGVCMKCCKCIKLCPKGAKYIDDEGYLYHKSELEEMYGGRRAEDEIFY
ncbi:MAG: EFR1 family ferrodoxin [Clostridiales bacterium]|nr:EFR1 family ferrodoxin [Clostridiales bacterium]